MSWKLFRALRHPSRATIPLLPAGVHFLETDTGNMFYSDGTSWFLSGVPPVGAFYTQYPAANSNTDADEFPVSARPASLFGGTWAEQWSTESVYFRTRGTLSDSGRVNGKQEDTLQGHGHYIESFSPGVGYGLVGSQARTPDSSLTGGAVRANILVANSTDGTPRSSAETRTVNRRIKVWKRTA